MNRPACALLRLVKSTFLHRSTIVLVVVSCMMPQPLLAEASAAELIKEGIELRRAGRDLEAIPIFKKAYEIDPSPRAAAQLGLCFQAVGRWSEAEPKLAEALTAANDPWIQKNRRNIKDALEAVKVRVGRVEVLGGPQGARVSVNGKVVGNLPLEEAVAVNEGLVDIEVVCEGFDRDHRTINIPGGSYQRLVVRLSASPLTPSGASPVRQSVNATGGESPNPSLIGESPPQNEDNSFYRSAWFWGGVVSLVALGAVATFLLTAGGEQSPRFDDSGELK